MFGITRAPDFEQSGLTWFNTPHALNLSHLRGRMVILDFWTSGCINCLHVLPSLRRLEEAHPQEVVVIGVHSPKFSAERDPALLASVIDRQRIRHPIVHDPDLRLWNEYGVRAWPTLVFLSPDGYVIGQMTGEPNPDALIDGVGDMLRQFWARGEMNPGELPLVGTPPRAGQLRFPGKIKTAPWHEKRWAVADSGHNRVLVLDDDGTVVARYGSGEAGFSDGEGWEATFNAPQGLCCTEEAIFVADTGNHAVRRIDRRTGHVATLAGTGRRGGALKAAEPGGGAALASPWDVERTGDRLFVANAGTHQILCLDLKSKLMRPFAGSGVEDLMDGVGIKARFAQPSGLAISSDRRFLWVADAESSAVRRVQLDGKTKVETVVGKGLFEFGLHNGALAEAQLQHPLAVAALNDRVVVADSYNNRVAVLDLTAKTARDLAEEDFICEDAEQRPLAEPSGLALDGSGRLLVADTNNHRIVEYRLAGRRWRTWFL